MKTTVSSLLLLILFMFACKKEKLAEEDPIPVTPVTPVIPSTLASEITYGDPSNMTITVHNSLLIGAYYKTASLAIDLDQDQVNDIKIAAVIAGSPGLGSLPQCSITCLTPNAKLTGITEVDTTFYHDIKKIVFDSVSNKVYDVLTSYSSCYKQTAKDSITDIYNDFKLTANTEGMKLKRDDEFYSIHKQLNENSYTINSGGTVGDTVHVSIGHHYNNCDNYPTNKPSYIGIKIISNQVEKLGWIKVNVLSGYEINVIESAIQK